MYFYILEKEQFKAVEKYMKQDRTPFAFLSDLKPSTTYKILILIYTLNGSVIEGDRSLLYFVVNCYLCSTDNKRVNTKQ